MENYNSCEETIDCVNNRNKFTAAVEVHNNAFGNDSKIINDIILSHYNEKLNYYFQKSYQRRRSKIGLGKFLLSEINKVESDFANAPSNPDSLNTSPAVTHQLKLYSTSIDSLCEKRRETQPKPPSAAENRWKSDQVSY